MGCVSSKRVEASVAAADVYCLQPPTSVAVFDINAIDEPWLIAAGDGGGARSDQKHTHVRIPVLEKLESFDQLAPKSWSEVSKALEDLKPSLQKPPAATAAAPPSKLSLPPPPAAPSPQCWRERQKPASEPAGQKNQSSFHTLEELEAKLKEDKRTKHRQPAAASPPSPLPPPVPAAARSVQPSLADGARPVSQNSFVLRDREEREKIRREDGPEDPTRRWRRNPLDGLPELCPPGGAEKVVLYTTTLRGVRRTFEDCERARGLVEAHCPDVDVDERDVSLHGEFLKELRELVGEEAAVVPRLFVKGRYVGGVDEVVEFNEMGRLRLVLRQVARTGGNGRKGCGGCGGARFVPCTACSGSCKVVAEDGKSAERCPRCNENGLIRCPHCP